MITFNIYMLFNIKKKFIYNRHIYPLDDEDMLDQF